MESMNSVVHHDAWASIASLVGIIALSVDYRYLEFWKSGSNFSEIPAAFIVYTEDGGSRLTQSFGTYIPK